MSDAVNHPKHYNLHPSEIECIYLVEDFNFNIGNAIKYLWRAGKKTNVEESEDIYKAKFYINREFNRFEVYKEFHKDKVDLLNYFSAYKLKESVTEVAIKIGLIISSDPDSLLSKFLDKVIRNEDPRTIFND